MYWTLELASHLEDLDDDELYECIEDIWPDYPTKEDFFWNERLPEHCPDALQGTFYEK